MVASEAPPACPVCSGILSTAVSREDRGQRVQCLNCGDHLFTVNALREIADLNAEERPRLAYGIVKLPTGTRITSHQVAPLLAASSLPSPLERIDNFVQHLAGGATAGVAVQLSSKHLVARLGCERSEGAAWVMKQAKALGYVDAEAGGILWALTAAGWRHHEALQRSGAGSRHAFMAMKFGDAEMDRVLSEYLQPAVAQTGFELRTTVGDHQTAGSIDNRMRVEIRTSRFVLCDLTHGNQGVYWEAGFAEGLGRPVIYTCRRDVLETPRAVHFDTAHQLIIKWDMANMDKAMQELKATIRATLPAEARLQD